MKRREYDDHEYFTPPENIWGEDQISAAFDREDQKRLIQLQISVGARRFSTKPAGRKRGQARRSKRLTPVFDITTGERIN